MDRANLRNMHRICGGDSEGKLHLLLEYAGRQGDILDPWYTGDFRQTWRDVEEGCSGLLEHLNNAVLYLASSEASYLTGINIAVDGGRKEVQI